MTLLSVTDSGLLMGLFLGLVFCIAVIWGIVYAVNFAINTNDNKLKRNYTIGSVFGLVVLVLVAHIPYTEYNLLTNYIWVDGTLVGKCYLKGAGKAYEFEYYVDGKRYTNCNSIGDAAGINFPNGVYKVRVSRAAPSIGRIDFGQKVADK
jgi:hypothetical protein